LIPPGSALLRDAAEADLPAITAILNDAISNTTAVWSLKPTDLAERLGWWRARVDAGFPVLVALQDNAVVGFASYAQFRPWEGYARTVEHSIYVARSARRQGIGALLLDALVERATTAGLHRMVAGVDATNQGSIDLHLRAGFTEQGRLSEVGRKFDRWLDLLFLVRALAP